MVDMIDIMDKGTCHNDRYAACPGIIMRSTSTKLLQKPLAGYHSGQQHSQLIHNLKERIKELRCVYAISKICENPGISIENILQQIVDLLPASWQYPDIASARLTLRGERYRTPNFVKTRYQQHARIFISGRQAGLLEICYLRHPRHGKSTLFLMAEQELLHMIAEQIGRIVELKDAEKELKSAHEQLRSLLRGVENAREHEKKRIAHELHDELGHALMALKIDLGVLRDECPGIPAVLGKTQAMSAAIDTTIHNLQRIAWGLKPVLLEEFGLSAAVATLGKEFKERSGISCVVRGHADLGELNQELSLILYRTIQELLTNVARHAKATRVTINLKKIKDKLVLSVKDNGKGIDRNALLGKKTLGLLGIRERVHSRDGTLQILDLPDHGTNVVITIPFPYTEGGK